MNLQNLTIGKLSPIFKNIFAALILCAIILLSGEVSAQQTAPAKPRPGGMSFTEPDSMDFNDHAGYVSLFDEKSLK